jgi:hypothetical protein
MNGVAAIGPIDKVEAALQQYLVRYMDGSTGMLNAEGQALLRRYQLGQKTVRGVYHTLALAANQNVYTFFGEGLPAATPVLSNQTKNTLDRGNMLIIQRVNFQIMTIVNATTAPQVTAINPIDAYGTNSIQPLLAGGTFTFRVNNGVVIDRFPITSTLPSFNAASASANRTTAVSANAAAGTPIVFGLQNTGQYFLELPVPLILDELVQYDLLFNPPPIYALTENTYLRCTLEGLGVLPNPGLI